MTAQATALALLEARKARRPAGPLAFRLAPATVSDGIATQLALARLMHAHPPGGFKIGAIARRMQDNLGIHAPIAGFMRAQDIHASGATLRFSDFRNVGVECELAVRLGRDLPPGPCDEATATSSVDALFPAIEIVENRYGPDLAAVGVPTLIADQMFHAACVLGADAPWHGTDLAAVRGELRLAGTLIDSGTGGDLMGHPMRALAWLAQSPEAASFGGLRRGQIVMLGSVTPPLWLSVAGHVEVHFAGLGKVDLTFA